MRSMYLCCVLLSVGMLLIAVSSAYDGQIEPKLINIGTIEGKSFFADNTKRNWTATKAYCESFGMELASITSLGQRDFLSSKFNESIFFDYHWTAGRDSHQARQLSWHYDDSEVSATVANTLEALETYESCLLFCPQCPIDFYIRRCALEWYALCET